MFCLGYEAHRDHPGLQQSLPTRCWSYLFGGQNGVFHDIRDFADPDDGPPFLAEFADQLTVCGHDAQGDLRLVIRQGVEGGKGRPEQRQDEGSERSEEHTSEIQSLMSISYAFFCLQKKTTLKVINK